MEINKDYYTILDLPSNSLAEDIRKTYRKLVRQAHPDVNDAPDAADRFREIQEAYEILSDPVQRKKYDHWRRQQGLDKQSALTLQTVASHKTLHAMRSEQAYYVCLDVTPHTDLPKLRLPLNLCLVIDRSTSMEGARLRQIKKAIHHIIDQLQPEDALSLVVFSDRAEVLLPSQTDINPVQVRALVETIQPGGATEILQGLNAGLQEVQRNQSKDSINYLILLTDGQTYGDEQACLAQAKWAEEHQINLNTIGIGSDWNEELLDQIATLSGGRSLYIDSPEKTKRVFSETLQDLETTVARKLTMKLNLHNEVRLHECYQITPYISRLETKGDKIVLGSLSAGQTQTILMEFRVKGLTPGERRLMRVTVEGDMPGQNKHRPWEWTELKAQVNETPGLNAEIPSVIKNALSKLSIFKMQEKVVADLQVGQVSTASERLKIMATQLLDLGETNLANAAMLEAGQLARTQMLSAEGRKKIRYGTRALATVALNAAKLQPAPV